MADTATEKPDAPSQLPLADVHLHRRIKDVIGFACIVRDLGRTQVFVGEDAAHAVEMARRVYGEKYSLSTAMCQRIVIQNAALNAEQKGAGTNV